MTNGIKYTYGITAQNELGFSSPVTLFRRVAPGFRPQQVASVGVYPQSDTTALVTWVPSGVVATPPIEWFVAKAFSCNAADTILSRSQYPYLSNVLISSLNTASQYRFAAYAVNDPGYSIPVFTPYLTIPNVNTTDLIVYLSAESYPGYGQWLDRSGNNYNAVIENGTATLNAAQNGLVLNGSTNWRFPPTGPRGIGSYSTFTLQTWFKQTGDPVGPDNGAGACVVTETYSGNTVNMAITTSYSNDLQTRGGTFYNGAWNFGPDFSISNNEWHNLAITYNGSQLISYKDGYPIGTVSGSDAGSLYNNYYRIGRRWDYDCCEAYIVGEIGQVLIYGRALSAVEVLQNVSSYAYNYPTAIQNIQLSTLQPAVSSLTISWEEAPDLEDVVVTFFQTPTNNVFTGGSTIDTAVTVGSPSTILTKTVPLTHGYYYFGTVGFIGGTQYSSATNYYPYPTLSTATMQDITLYSANMRVNYTMNGYHSTSVQFYSNTVSSDVGRTALSSLVYTGPAVSSATLSTNNYPLIPNIWYSADVTVLGSGSSLTASSAQVSSPIYAPFFLSTLVPNAPSLTAKWTATPPYPSEVQFYVANSANPSGVFSTFGPRQYTNSSISSVTYNTMISTGSYYFAGITYSTGTISTFTSTLLAPNSLSNVTISSLTYESQSLTGFFRVSPSANVSLDFYSNATAATTGGTLLSTVTVTAGSASNATINIQPNTGIYYYTVGRTTGQPNITSPSATQGLNPLSSIYLSTLTAYATSLTAGWASAYNSSISLAFFSTNVLTASGGGLISTIVTNNGTSTYTLAYQPYPSTLYYVKGTYAGQPTISTVSSIMMPSPITNVLLDQMTINSTDFASSWTAAPSTAVTVRYYSTTSATIPGSRSLIGSAQSVLANISTNSLSPAQTPLANVYYYVGVTPALGPEVLSPTAVQLVDPYPSSLKGSVQFTGGYLSLTSNWTLPIYGDPFTIEMFISTTLPLATSPKTNTLTNWGNPDQYNAINSFEIQKTSGNDYYLVSLANQRPTGNMAALIPTVVNGGWHHMVAQGLNSTYSLYYDGLFLGSTTVGFYSTFSTFNNFTVGGNTADTVFSGFIASLRIVNGINVYSGIDTSTINFTVPTQPLTATQGSSANIQAITGVNQNTESSIHVSTGNNYTSMLLDTYYNTPYADESSNAFTMATNNTSKGTVAASPANPFGPTIYPLRVSDAPTNVVGSPGTGQVVVTWSLPLSNGGAVITSYTITAVGGASQTVSGASITTYTFTGLTNGTAYTFTVYATNSAGNSPTSTASSAVTPRAVADAPTSLVATNGNTTASIAFTPGSTNGGTLSNYKYSTDGGTNFTAFSPAQTSSPVSITGLTNGTTYSVKLMAVTEVGDGTASAAVSVTPSTVPGAPTSVAGTHGNTQVALTWSAPSSTGGAAIDYYTAYYSTDGTNYTTFATTFPSTSGTVTGLTNGTAYTFKVTAHNLNGDSALSVASSAVTPSTVPGAPTNVTGTQGNTEVALTWSAPSSTGGAAIDYYTAYYSTDGTNYTTFGTTFPSTSGTVTGLTNGTAYTFKVSAHNLNGDSALSTVSSILVTTDMLLYLDTGNLASYSGTGTTWTDLSPNANNATSLTGTTYSSLNGGYLSFNGSGSGSLVASKYNPTYTGKTVFVAGNLTSIGNGTYRAFLGASAGSRNFNLYMYSPSSGVYQLHYSTGSSGSFSGSLSGNLGYTLGNWFTVAVTQATDGTTIYYLNGQQVSQTTMSFSQFLSGSTENVGRADNFWNGPLPIICVYKTTLTAAQILANHNSVRGRYGLA